MEAYRTFRTTRSFFFWLLLLGMLITGAGFWLVDRGVIDQALLLESDDVGYVRIQAVGGTPHGADPLALWQTAGRQNRTVDIVQDLISLNLKIWNVIIAFSAVIYCLALLIGLKLALVGGLGGLADASKAFFLSLILMVLLLPWQRAINPEIPGALYGYPELIRGYRQLHFQEGVQATLIYYGRFVGLWALGLILLLVAQWRSRQAAKRVQRSIARYAERGAAETPAAPESLPR